MSNRFFARLPTVDMEVRVNDASPEEFAKALWGKVAHTFYDRPKDFAADCAEYYGAKKEATDEEVADFRRRMAQAIEPGAAHVEEDEADTEDDG